MMPISVNVAIDQLKEIGKREVEVFGILELEFEGQCITHIPKNEQHTDSQRSRHLCQSSIWTNYNLKEMGMTEEGLKKFDKRIVVLSGYLMGPDKDFDGCGHFCGWPAEIDVINIKKYKNRT